MNPLLDTNYFIPDVEAHVMPNGKLYIYGSKDNVGNGNYCSYEYNVFSCEDSNLENWKAYVTSFQNYPEGGDVPWKTGELLYAPDAISKNGNYYLYFSTSGNGEGVAISNHPEGPFSNAKPIKIADGDSIDPACFVDDDQTAYYFWGQFNLKGAKLKDDMCTIDENTLNTSILTEEEHGFHEGACIRKHNHKYYLVYTDVSRGKATCLGYAMSDFPLGPYKKQGIIIDNTYCDPKNWNNHGSIECFHGQWYVFYHRSTNNSENTRRVCAEPIFFNSDGTIDEVEMTTNGASQPINAFKKLNASTACRINGGLYIKTTINNEGTDEILVNCGSGKWKAAWAEYKYLDFQDGVKKCEISIKGQGKVLLTTENSMLCGSCEINSLDYFIYTFDVKNLLGVKPIWFSFVGENIEFSSFKFL